jgi:anti-sigma regulatory factor (Ser/Thr protein kinase)
MPNDTRIRLASSDHVVERHVNHQRRTTTAVAPFDATPLDDNVGQMLRLPSTIDAPRRARKLVADSLTYWGHTELIDPANLVVSELVANAVRYGGADLTVTLARQGDSVRIAVGDTGTADPALPEVDRRALGGRGLRLIGALASDWGFEHKAGGKIVWALIAEDRLHGSDGMGRSTRVPATRPR